MQAYQLIPNNQTSQAVATFIQSLSPLNSAANPIIYCMFSANLGKYIRWDVLNNLPSPILGERNQIFKVYKSSLSEIFNKRNIFYCSLVQYLYFRNLWCYHHCCCCCLGEEEFYRHSSGLSSAGLRTTSTLLSSSTGHSVHNHSAISNKDKQVQICAATIAAHPY